MTLIQSLLMVCVATGVDGSTCAQVIDMLDLISIVCKLRT